jgi:hypothetical protein
MTGANLNNQHLQHFALPGAPEEPELVGSGALPPVPSFVLLSLRIPFVDHRLTSRAPGQALQQSRGSWSWRLK